MAGITRPKTLKVYQTLDGKEPYTEWLESLKDYTIRARILRRLERLKQGNYGDCKSVGSQYCSVKDFCRLG
ncbi:MAG: hypothetical protein KME64_24305 [Scytonematopsis contorta HA4267-MV1]|nr:hypothetical protein [Scytonematopsis contorta HA4267-MV1]